MLFVYQLITVMNVINFTKPLSPTGRFKPRFYYCSRKIPSPFESDTYLFSSTQSHSLLVEPLGRRTSMYAKCQVQNDKC